MNKPKVLFFVDRMRVGGIQTLLVHLFEQPEFSAIQPELLLLDDGQEYDLKQKVEQMGIPVHQLKGIWVKSPKDYLAYCKAMKNFFAAHHDYQAVHMNSGPKNFFVLYYAKQYGIPVRIAHSHNTGYQTSSKAQIWLGECFKLPLRRYASHYLACSDLAGAWMFGKKNQKSGRVQVIPNGIELEKYQFNQQIRDEVRSEWDVQQGTLVIGNVGRFTKQKNHGFLLEIFAELCKIKPNSKLVLSGIGEEMERAKSKAQELEIQDKVLFLGFRQDVPRLVQGMDVFLMPSLYEGFPVTAVEAQASGLPCVFTDTITREAAILPNVGYLSLSQSPCEWAKACTELAHSVNRQECTQQLEQAGYSIHEMARCLIQLYITGKGTKA